MKEQTERQKLIVKADRLLADVVVRGESVLLLADARALLGKLYRMEGETEAEQDG